MGIFDFSPADINPAHATTSLEPHGAFITSNIGTRMQTVSQRYTHASVVKAFTTMYEQLRINENQPSQDSRELE